MTEPNPLDIVEPVVLRALEGLGRSTGKTVPYHAVNVVVLPASDRKALRIPADEREFVVMRADGRVQRRSSIMSRPGNAAIHFRRAKDAVYDVTVTTFV